MWRVTPFTHPLLLLVGRHPCTLVREVAVVAPSTHVVMGVVAASLSPNLIAHWRWGRIGCPRAGLLDGAQSTVSHAMWGSVTPTEKQSGMNINQ